MMSSMLSIFSFQALEKLDLEIMDFWLFIELSILEWFPTWFFKYVLIPIRNYFQTAIALLYSSWPPVLVLNIQTSGGRVSSCRNARAVSHKNPTYLRRHFS